jgi:hypothetical protein
VLFSLFLFLLIKPFWLMALVPGFIGWAAFRQKQNAVLAIVASYVLVLLLAMVVGLISSDYHLPSLLFGEQRNMWRFSVFGGAGSLIEPVGFAPTWLSLFKHVPETFVLTMIQPLPASWDDWESLFLFSENILFPVLVILMLLRRDVLFRLWSSPALVLAICTGFIIVLVSGFTTPVAGTLIRYRWPGLLLLLMALSTVCFSRSSTDAKADAGGSPD